jgi:hypothetical protein
MNCKICNSETVFLGTPKILNKYFVKYFNCKSCGLIFTEEPYWLGESYTSAISRTDIGTMYRNFMSGLFLKLFIFIFQKGKGKYLDFGGGYGILVRMMRDFGYDFYSYDKYCDNLFSDQFTHKGDIISKYTFLSAFEVFEHFVDPLNDINKLFDFSDTLLFSTNIYKKNPPEFLDWWYYGLDHGQHVSIYSNLTLKNIAEKNGAFYYTNGKDFHIYSRTKLNYMKVKIFFISFRISRRIFSSSNSLISSDFQTLKTLNK